MTPELAQQLTALDPVQLGGRIKAARVAAGLTQPELAGPDASVAYLSRIESGQRRAGTDLLQTLATRLGVTVEYLAYGAGLGGRRAARAAARPRGAVPGRRRSRHRARAGPGGPRLPRPESVNGGIIRARYVEAAALDAMGDHRPLPSSSSS